MGEVIKIPKLELKVKDVFSIGDFLSMMNEWLKENNFKTLEGASIGDSNQETIYTHKMTGGGSQMDVSMWWRMLAYPPENGAKKSYVRYRLNIDMSIRGDAAEVEVMHKGKKVKLNKAEVKIELNPFVELDPDGEWEKQGLLKLVKDVFRKKIYNQEIEEHKEYFYNTVFRLHTLIKQYFRLETYMPEETTAVPPKGLI